MWRGDSSRDPRASRRACQFGSFCKFWKRAAKRPARAASSVTRGLPSRRNCCACCCCGGLLLRDPEAPVGLLGAQVAKLIALLGDEFAPLRRRQVRVAQVLPLLGQQVTQLLAVLQAGLRVALQLLARPAARRCRRCAVRACLAMRSRTSSRCLAMSSRRSAGFRFRLRNSLLCFARRSRSCWSILRIGSALRSSDRPACCASVPTLRWSRCFV